MQISHAYSQTVPDGTATSVVRPSDWNSNHNIVLNLSGNTLGSSRITGQALTFVGGNNITLSADTANSRLNFVGPTQSVQTQASGNIARTGYTSTTQAGSTVGVTLNTNGLSMAYPPFLTTTPAQTNQSLSMAAVGNTTGNTSGMSVDARSLSFQGLGAASIGLSTSAGGSSLLVSVPVQSVQTQAAGNLARTGYTSTTQAGATVGVTHDTNGLSVAWPSFLTTAPAAQTTQTQPAGNIVGAGYTSTTQNGSTVGVTQNSNGLSAAWPAFITTYVAQTTQTQPAGNIAGVGTTFAGTNISATMGLNSNGLALSLSGPAAGGGGGNTADTFYVQGNTTGNSSGTIAQSQLNISAAGALTAGLSNSSLVLSAPGASQLFQAGNVSISTNGASISISGFGAGTGYTSTTQAGSTVGVTQATNGLSVAWPAFITAGGGGQTTQTQPAGNIAGAGYTSTTQAGSTVGATQNSNGLSMAWPAFLTTQSVQTQASGNIARTGYTSTTQAGSTVGATLNTNGLSMAWPPFLTTYVGQTTQTQPAGNIAGIGTTFNGVNVSGSITFNSNGINLSLSAAAGGTGGGGGADGVNVISLGSSGNTAGTAWSSSNASIGLYGAGAVTVSQNNSNQIQISAPSVSSMYAGANITLASAGNSVSIIGQAAGAPDRRFKEIYPGERFTTIVGLSATKITNRAMFIPFWMEGTGLVPNTARLMMSFGASSNRSLGGTFRLGLYYQTNSTQLSLVTSNSWSASITASSQSSAWNGIAWVDFNLGGYTITAEGRYVLALQVNPVSANATWMAVSLYGGDTISSQSRVWNNGTTQALSSNSQFIPFWGAYSTTSAGLPNTVGLTQINGASSQFQLQYYAALREI